MKYTLMAAALPPMAPTTIGPPARMSCELAVATKNQPRKPAPESAFASTGTTSPRGPVNGRAASTASGAKARAKAKPSWVGTAMAAIVARSTSATASAAIAPA